MAEKRIYKTIATVTTDSTESWTVPSGTIVNIKSLGANGAVDASVTVCIVWDTEILLSTHGDYFRECDIMLTGDGVKVLKIQLDNQSANSETIGGFYTYEQS